MRLTAGSSHFRPTRQRRLDWGLKGDVIGWNLVQGGRWLLIGGGAHPGVLGANGKMDVGEDGEVVLCDLEKGTSDNTMLVQKLIIPTCEKDKQNVHGIATDVDESQERLTFNVALTLWSYNGRTAFSKDFSSMNNLTDRCAFRRFKFSV